MKGLVVTSDLFGLIDVSSDEVELLISGRIARKVFVEERKLVVIVVVHPLAKVITNIKAPSIRKHLTQLKPRCKMVAAVSYL